MSAVEKIKAAPSPSAALIVLAEEVDALAARLAESPAPDPWSEWDDPETHQRVNAEFVEMAREERTQLEGQIGALRDAIGNATDPEEIQAMQAALRLKQDELKPKPESLDNQGERVKIDAGDGQSTVYLVPPSDEQIEWRESVLEQLDLNATFGEHANDTFVKGGPLWLYYGNRDFVMGLSEDMKRAFVHDVAQQSPAEAHELGRDVLKDLTTGDGPEEMLGRILGN